VMANPIVPYEAQPVQPGVRERGQVQRHNSKDQPMCDATDAEILPDSPSLQGGYGAW
jgi:hypothetical protein